jgi:Bacterial Ig-like domain (group 2)
MCSSFRTMLTTLLACSILGGCTNDLLAPGAENGVSASVATSAMAMVASPVTMTVADSLLNIGDTVRIAVTAINPRTNRDVTREAKISFASSDTSVASVDRKGLVKAHNRGRATITARSALGRASVAIAVGVTAKLDSTLVAKLPALPPVDTTPAPAPPAPVPPTVPPAPEPPVAPDLGGAPPPINTPMFPAASVNVAVPAVTGRTIRVPAADGAALQAALNSAVGGDEILLANGSEYVGNFTLPKHSGSGIVTVRSATVAVPFGTRATPSNGSDFARITSNAVAAVVGTADGATGWRLTGLNIGLRTGTPENYGIVVLGRGTETQLAQLVSNIVLDRVLITATETGTTSRCVAFNGNELAVINSWLAECHAKGRDAQGIGGWTGMGPFLIENNHIEGSGQNIMFGGADPAIANVTPSDITIRGNHLFKPLSWGNGKWTVKAAFELKHARRVLFEGNVIENHWIDAQVGYAVLFQAASQDANAPWSKIWDVTMRNNIIKNSTGGFNLLSRVMVNGRLPDEPTRRILVKNNLFLNVGRDPISGVNGRLVQLMSDHEDVSLIQNTFFGSHANNAMMFDGAPNKRLTLFNNLFSSNEYGVSGSGFGEGSLSLAQFAPGSVVEGNALVGRIARLYPARNSFPATLASTDFVNAAGGDYTLRSTVPYSSNAGSLVGVSGATLMSAVQNAVTR